MKALIVMFLDELREQTLQAEGESVRERQYYP